MAQYARVCRLEFGRRPRLDGGDRRKWVRDGADNGEVDGIGWEVDVLRNGVRDLLADHVRRGRLFREVGDAEPAAQDRAAAAEEIVGQAEPGRDVAIVRTLVDGAAGPVFAGVNQPQTDGIEVDDLVVLFGLGAKDLV